MALYTAVITLRTDPFGAPDPTEALNVADIIRANLLRRHGTSIAFSQTEFVELATTPDDDAEQDITLWNATPAGGTANTSPPSTFAHIAD